MITRPSRTPLAIEGLPAFADNYLWLIHDGKDAAIVDPGDATVVQEALGARQLRLQAILVTHHHPDHVGGVQALKATTGATVYAPAAEAAKIPGIDRGVADADIVDLQNPALKLQVIAVPGHTLGHVAYYCAGYAWLFCGDTLFSGGCGRLFEGSPGQMHASLQRLAALPGATQVYCAHEYTVANLRFAHAVESGNAQVGAALARATALRAAGQPTLPTSIGRERQINPFLRCHENALAAAVQVAPHGDGNHDVEVFATLRRQKDVYRG